MEACSCSPPGVYLQRMHGYGNKLAIPFGNTRTQPSGRTGEDGGSKALNHPQRSLAISPPDAALVHLSPQVGGVVGSVVIQLAVEVT